MVWLMAFITLLIDAHCYYSCKREGELSFDEMYGERERLVLCVALCYDRRRRMRNVVWSQAPNLVRAVLPWYFGGRRPTDTSFGYI